MASYKILSLFAIASTVFSLSTGYANAQVAIGGSQSNALSLSHQMLLDMQQSGASVVGGPSMQLLKFTNKNVSFEPLDGLDRLFNWQPTKEAGVMTTQTLGDRVEQFKSSQRQQIVSDSQIFQAINQIK
jgi:hypothetical protein